MVFWFSFSLELGLHLRLHIMSVWSGQELCPKPGDCLRPGMPSYLLGPPPACGYDAIPNFHTLLTQYLALKPHSFDLLEPT